MNPLHRERVVTSRGVTLSGPHDAHEEPAPESTRRPAVGAERHELPAETGLEERISVLATEEARALEERWRSIASAFVDAPRSAVAQADELTGDLIERVMQALSDERATLHAALEDASLSTEELRQALRRYRTLFERLLPLP